jgi:hypothetical protein
MAGRRGLIHWSSLGVADFVAPSSGVLGAQVATLEEMKAIGRGLGAVGVLALSLSAMAAGCSEDGSSTGQNEGGAGAGDGKPDGGTVSKGGGGSAGEAVGGSDSDPSCDCGDDVNDAHVPLECACGSGQCSTFETTLERYRAPSSFGSPFYVLLGSCSGGYRKLVYEEALEQAGESTFDAEGALVYSRFGGYSPTVPEACGFAEAPSLGAVVIGEDPSQDCDYCLVVAEEGGVGGASNGEPSYPESTTAPCTPSLLE